ncbi:uncharacterized protein [Lolium perenne]|uniref:uncharacterized protein n=1 Tax=Lolium perenne TaxID=4522 RepID=UPI0021E9E93C|nr:uncharacterized protein LOC127326324 [Lolium perenne]
MGQEEALLPAPVTVAFSWEHEPIVPKAAIDAGGGMPQSPKKAPATVVLSWDHEQGITKLAPAPAMKPRGVPEGPRKGQAPTRRLSVPPPPGRLSTRGVSRAVRPEDDPFLAAYLACTKSTGGRSGDGGRRAAKEQRRFAWAGLGLGSLSCKRNNGVVEQSMVRMAKLPELDPRDA